MGVKFVLSLSDIKSEKLKKVFQEGETRIYENKNVMPRAFFVQKIEEANNKEEAISKMLEDSFDLNSEAVIEDPDESLGNVKQTIIGKAHISYYSENKVIIETENSGIGFLVFTDTFYPAWRVNVDGKTAGIYRTDYNFRGVIVPDGEHIVEFYTTLL